MSQELLARQARSGKPGRAAAAVFRVRAAGPGSKAQVTRLARPRAGVQVTESTVSGSDVRVRLRVRAASRSLTQGLGRWL